MGLLDLFYSGYGRYVVGFLLISIGLFVIPYITGQGPLSVSALSASVSSSPYVVSSISYDRSNNVYFGEITVFGGTSSGDYERVMFNLSGSSKAEYKIDSDPFYLVAKILKQQMLVPYQREGYVGDVVCFSATGRDKIGYLFLPDDIVRAVDDAVNHLEAGVGDVSSYDHYVFVITDLYAKDGYAFADVTFCGTRPDVVAFYARTPDQQVYAEINVWFQNSTGNVTDPVTITSTMGASRSMTLTSNGKQVGSVTFLGIEKGTSFDELFSDLPQYLMVPKQGNSFSVFVPSHSYPYYLTEYSKAERYIEGFEYFARHYREYSYATMDLGEFLGHPLCLAGPVGCILSITLSRATYGAILDLFNSKYGGHVVILGETKIDLGYRNLLPINREDFKQLVSTVQAYHNQLYSEFSHSVSALDYFVRPGSGTPPDRIILERNITGFSAYGYRLRFAVSAEFVGIRAAIPEPEIVDVRVAGGKCNDLGCSVTVSLKNRSDKYGGLVTVSVVSNYTSPAESTVYLPPGGTASTSVFLVPTVKLTKPTNVMLKVVAEATHWLSSNVDQKDVSVTFEPEKTCLFTQPVCVYDTNAGLWAVLKCDTPYAPQPTKTYCSKGEVCSGGRCVQDIVTSVGCVDKKRYEVLYKYKGAVYQSCSEGYVCSDEKAKLGEIPPCVEANFTPVSGYGVNYTPSPVRIVEQPPDYRDMSRGFILIGLGVILR